LTPPFGLLLFTMKGVAPPAIRMNQIYRASLPFVAMSLLLLVAIFFVPAIATWLPRFAGG
jgi:TRAP-type mannitol/chloroaromatic compound transport system permease large subunit